LNLNLNLNNSNNNSPCCFAALLLLPLPDRSKTRGRRALVFPTRLCFCLCPIGPRPEGAADNKGLYSNTNNNSEFFLIISTFFVIILSFFRNNSEFFRKNTSNNKSTSNRFFIPIKIKTTGQPAKVQDKKYAQATTNAKESSRKSLTQSNHDSNVNDTESLNLTKGSESPMSVSS